MMKKKRIFGVLILFLTLCACFAPRVQAAYPAALSAAHPLVGYPLSRARKTIVYTDAERKNKLISLSYREFTITKYDKDSQSLYVTCKEGKKTVKGWVKRNTFFFTQKFQAVQSFANQSLTLYRGKSRNMYYQTVPLYAGGSTVGESGAWYQMTFYLNGRYYLGWIPKAEYGKVRLSMDTTEQLLADGVYSIRARQRNSFSLTADTEKETALLRKTTGKENQLYTLKHEDNNRYTISPYGSDRYLGLKDGKLSVVSEKTRWIFTRYGRYFALREEKSKKGIAFVSGKGIREWKYARTSAAQNWVFTKTTVKEEETKNTVFSQYDPKWGGNTYCNGNPVRTISTSGCGVVSFVNAIYALNGEYIDPTMLAQYSNSHGHYFYMQGTADTLYEDFARTNGKFYHFKWDGKIYDMTSLKRHLQNGGTAVALVPGHYIAIVDYREADNSFLVLDSAIYGKRPTTIHGDWINEGTLRSGTMYCSYFHLFSRVK